MQAARAFAICPACILILFVFLVHFVTVFFFLQPLLLFFSFILRPKHSNNANNEVADSKIIIIIIEKLFGFGRMGEERKNSIYSKPTIVTSYIRTVNIGPALG